MADDIETGATPVATPPIEKVVSAVGRDAVFRDPDTEVERILTFSKNYYIVLKVRKDTDPAVIRSNYLRLSRLVHPDKCRHPRAPEAAAIVNQARDTLTNSIKKMAYDAYVADVNVNAPEGVSYAQWEAEQAAQPVQLPAWLQTFLRIPGAGIILLLILLPLTLVLIVLVLVLWIICIPISILLRCCGIAPQPPPEMTEQEAAAYRAAAAAGAKGQAPPQQPPPARDTV